MMSIIFGGYAAIEKLNSKCAVSLRYVRFWTMRGLVQAVAVIVLGDHVGHADLAVAASGSLRRARRADSCRGLYATVIRAFIWPGTRANATSTSLIVNRCVMSASSIPG